MSDIFCFRVFISSYLDIYIFILEPSENSIYSFILSLSGNKFSSINSPGGKTYWFWSIYDYSIPVEIFLSYSLSL